MNATRDVNMSVCLQYGVKTAEYIVEIFLPPASTITLVFTFQ